MEIPSDLVKFIPLKNSLSKHVLFYTVLQEVVKLLKAIPSVELLRLDPELTLVISIVVISTVKDKDIDQRLLVTQILDNIFTLSDDEKLIIDKQYQYDLDNNKIKPIHWSKRLMESVKNVFSLFFLGV